MAEQSLQQMRRTTRILKVRIAILEAALTDAADFILRACPAHGPIVLPSIQAVLGQVKGVSHD